jgi:hypothetical protein
VNRSIILAICDFLVIATLSMLASPPVQNSSNNIISNEKFENEETFEEDEAFEIFKKLDTNYINSQLNEINFELSNKVNLLTAEHNVVNKRYEGLKNKEKIINDLILTNSIESEKIKIKLNFLKSKHSKSAEENIKITEKTKLLKKERLEISSRIRSDQNYQKLVQERIRRTENKEKVLLEGIVLSQKKMKSEGVLLKKKQDDQKIDILQNNKKISTMIKVLNQNYKDNRDVLSSIQKLKTTETDLRGVITNSHKELKSAQMNKKLLKEQTVKINSDLKNTASLSKIKTLKLEQIKKEILDLKKSYNNSHLIKEGIFKRSVRVHVEIIDDGDDPEVSEFFAPVVKINGQYKIFMTYKDIMYNKISDELESFTFTISAEDTELVFTKDLKFNYIKNRVISVDLPINSEFVKKIISSHRFFDTFKTRADFFKLPERANSVYINYKKYDHNNDHLLKSTKFKLSTSVKTYKFSAHSSFDIFQPNLLSKVTQKLILSEIPKGHLGFYNDKKVNALYTSDNREGIIIIQDDPLWSESSSSFSLGIKKGKFYSSFKEDMKNTAE